MSSSPGFSMGKQRLWSSHRINERVWSCGALGNGTLCRENVIGTRQIRARMAGKSSRRRYDRDQCFNSRRDGTRGWYVVRYTSSPTDYGPYCFLMSGWASSLTPSSHTLAVKGIRRFSERSGSGERQLWQMTLHHDSLPL